METLRLTPEHCDATDSYLAALLVRNPRYLTKLAQFHDAQGSALPGGVSRDAGIRRVALDNMLQVLETYRDRMSKAHLELILAGGGTIASSAMPALEPKNRGVPDRCRSTSMPPSPRPWRSRCSRSPRADRLGCNIGRTNNQGTARISCIALQTAERFVFASTRSPSASWSSRSFVRADIATSTTVELSERTSATPATRESEATQVGMTGSFANARFAGPFAYTRLWSRSSGSWRVVAGHASALAF